MLSKYEFVAKEVTPVLRSMVANELSKIYNLNQTEISKKMNITQPAVSQYLRKLRGSRQITKKEVSDKIKELSEKINKNEIIQDKINDELFKIGFEVEKTDLI